MFKPDAKEPQGPFHIRVRQEDLDQAQVVLTASGLAANQS
jgi:acyl-CoA thioesterase FadM